MHEEASIHKQTDAPKDTNGFSRDVVRFSDGFAHTLQRRGKEQPIEIPATCVIFLFFDHEQLGDGSQRR